jgi:hypothetical protein
LCLEHAGTLVIVESVHPDAPPVVHYWSPIVVPGTCDRLLKDAGWLPLGWSDREWGMLSLVEPRPVQ